MENMQKEKLMNCNIFLFYVIIVQQTSVHSISAEKYNTTTAAGQDWTKQSELR